MKKYIYFVEGTHGDDVGRGKSVVSKNRHKRVISKRLRRLFNKLYPKQQ